MEQEDKVYSDQAAIDELTRKTEARTGSLEEATASREAKEAFDTAVTNNETATAAFDSADAGAAKDAAEAALNESIDALNRAEAALGLADLAKSRRVTTADLNARVASATREAEYFDGLITNFHDKIHFIDVLFGALDPSSAEDQDFFG